MNPYSKNRQHTYWRSAILAILIGIGAQTVLAEDSGKAVEDGAKATEKGFGNLLKGMGQEVGKAMDSKDSKKNEKDKKTSKPADETKP